ncbi:MAG: DUF3299 domain-containing protein [Rhodobacteraceae bacterium]|nr:DUF3299 domain-containing protein [Paracoccaceae bacterium]
MVTSLSRRNAIALLAGATILPRAVLADAVVDLDWEDLLPKNQSAIPPVLNSLIEHDAHSLSSQQPASTGVRSDWNGMIVRLPGFIVPIDTLGAAVTAFILVPFVGACVHVPPPPANQLVFVTTPKPYETEGLYAPVNVTGMFGVSSMTTHLAQIGYALSAEKIEPF